MKYLSLGLLMASILLFSCSTTHSVEDYESETLKVYKLTDHTFVHVSYLQTNDFGKVACNGLIYTNDGEAVLFDTPTSDSVSRELIQWIQDSLHSEVKAVVIGHFHDDCLAGLGAFHEVGIPSYANAETVALARELQMVVPQTGFEGEQVLFIGGRKVMCRYLGAGHTKDNIVGYIPEEKVLFGGCLIKAIDASKGYLGDADVNAWPETVANVKAAFPDVVWVVPGHGEAGDTQLLDYTIELFQQKAE